MPQSPQACRSKAPGGGMAFTIPCRAEFSSPSQRPKADFEMVTPDYFKAFGIYMRMPKPSDFSGKGR